jgi:hypothetical protein
MSQDKVSPYTTPIDDWLLAAVLHVTVTLQNVLSSLTPIFEIIGFKNSCLNIPIVGFEKNDEVYEMDLKFDKEILSKLDISVENKIKDLFNSAIGISLLNFTKECMLVLAGMLLCINVDIHTYIYIYVYIYFIYMYMQIHDYIISSMRIQTLQNMYVSFMFYTISASCVHFHL